MVDFRKAILLLAVLVFATGIASAQALNCTLNGGAPPLLRAEGVAEEVGQAFITCTGGTATPTGQPVPRINIRLFTNGYNITSRLMTYSSTTVSEATLLIDDPAPANQYLATIPPATCNGPYNPATCGNVFLAYQVSNNTQAVEWRDIPFDPPQTTGVQRTLRFVNIRVNPALVTGGNVSSLIPSPVSIYLSISGTFTLPIASPFLTVGYVQNGLAFSLRGYNSTTPSSPGSSITSVALSQCTSPNDPAFWARFTELFPTAFRPQGTPGPQNVLTTIYNTESMFFGPVFGSLPAGQATQGTRLRLAFTGIPSGVDIYVPSTVTTGGLTGTLVAVGTDGSTADPSISTTGLGLPAGSVRVVLTGGAGSAVYTITGATAGSNENLDVPVYVRYSGLPSLGTGSVFGSYAPLRTTDVASSTAPVP
ncbi:MAG: hypothetical protein N2036_01015, partial [Bryobacteraceae bacterium]|nr:hypothetical protein [Bryobacteraceae bacterium]